MHFPIDVVRVCIRWYAAYSLSYRLMEEIIAKSGVCVNHSFINRWAVRFLPLLEKAFLNHKRALGSSWCMDATYIKVKGVGKYLHCTLDKEDQTVDFLLSAKPDKPAALRFFEKAVKANGVPEKVAMNRGGTSKAAMDEINTRGENYIVIR